MKTLIVLTNFSNNANHAAEYATGLAKKLKVNMLLCNALFVQAMIPEATMVAWPQEEYAMLSEDSIAHLKSLKKHLENYCATANGTHLFHPHIEVSSEVGNVCNIVNDIAEQKDVALIVAGTHEKDAMSDLLLGNNINKMINNITSPLLLVPPSASLKPVKKLAFATDLEFLEQDEDALHQLVEIARPLQAEIVITHIIDEPNLTSAYKTGIEEFLNYIAKKSKYAKITYRVISESIPEKGLSRVCEIEQVDLLAMVHRERNFFQKIFTHSHTQEVAATASMPLLIFKNQ